MGSDIPIVGPLPEPMWRILRQRLSLVYSGDFAVRQLCPLDDGCYLKLMRPLCRCCFVVRLRTKSGTGSRTDRRTPTYRTLLLPDAGRWIELRIES